MDCSFCGKDNDDDGQEINIFVRHSLICEDCIKLAQSVVDKEKSTHVKKWTPPEFKKEQNVLQRANDIVQERDKSYGNPYDDFKKTAMIWSAILGVDVTPDQIAKCMIGIKLSRLSATPDHQDSIDDIAGYTWTLDEVIKKTKELLCDTDQSLTR